MVYVESRSVKGEYDGDDNWEDKMAKFDRLANSTQDMYSYLVSDQADRSIALETELGFFCEQYRELWTKLRRRCVPTWDAALEQLEEFCQPALEHTAPNVIID